LGIRAGVRTPFFTLKKSGTHTATRGNVCVLQARLQKKCHDVTTCAAKVLMSKKRSLDEIIHAIDIA
jgi:hypothetical protein